MISADLGRPLESFIAKLVESGRYNSKSEVLREGVRLVQEREARFRELDAKIQAGLDDFAAGRSHPADEVFDRVRGRIAEVAARKASKAS